MYLVKTPSAVKPFSLELVWKVSVEEPVIYLTFDDGPSEHITGFILDELAKFDAKATFFCIGGNVEKFQEQYRRIISEGHRTGNHSWNHMNGWQFSDFSYYRNILDCRKVVDSNLFRPPYGRIRRRQAQALQHRFRIVMWDVLSADWDKSVAPEKCLSNVVNNAAAGSIVVFHDSEKAYRNMSYALPRTLAYFSEKGFRFETLPENV